MFAYSYCFAGIEIDCSDYCHKIQNSAAYTINNDGKCYCLYDDNDKSVNNFSSVNLDGENYRIGNGKNQDDLDKFNELQNNLDELHGEKNDE